MGTNQKVKNLRPVFLKGKDIFLATLSKKTDLGPYASWLNDQETTLYMGSGRFPSTLESLKKYIDTFNRGAEGILLGIFLNKTKRHIGNITLNSIDWRNRNAEIGILIGDKHSRGKGYAVQAIRLIVEHAFNRLNLHKLYAGMIQGNEASRKAFLKSGFKEEAVLKEHFYLNGEYRGCHRMGLLRSEAGYSRGD